MLAITTLVLFTFSVVLGSYFLYENSKSYRDNYSSKRWIYAIFARNFSLIGFGTSIVLFIIWCTYHLKIEIL